MPIISIIVPVYKVEQYLDQCIESILAQTFTDFELILVDDGSPDRCGDMCDEWAARDSRIVVIHKENGGLSSARNAALDLAKGEYIGFVDSDDYIEPDMYDYLYHHMIENQAEIASCGILECCGTKSSIRCPQKIETVMNNREAIRNAFKQRVVTVNAVTKLYQNNIFNELRFPNGQTTEDAYVIVDVLLKATKVFVSTLPKYNYVRRANSITTSTFSQSDLGVLAAYEHNLEVIRMQCPDLEDIGLYGIWWANRYLLNKLSFSSAETQKTNSELIKKVVHFCRKNLFCILKNKNHTLNHRIAYLLISFSPRVYMFVFPHWGTL